MDGWMQKHRMMRWLGRFFSFLLIWTLPLPLLAETVPMVDTFVPAHTTYRISLSFAMAGCVNSHLSTPEFDTPAEAVLAILPQKFDWLPCMGPGITAYYNYFKPDADPNKYQMWSVYSGVSPTYGPFFYDTHVQTLSPDAIGHPSGYKRQCPTPLTRPEVPFTPDANGVTCSRPDTLTITLYGGTEVEPSNGSDKKFLPIIATVLEQSTNKPPTNPVKVHVSLKVEDPKTGGHDHGDSTRPRGGIADVETCASDSECWSGTTDGNGQVVFNFNPTEAAGTHTISATCDGCSDTARKPVDVKVSDLWPIPGSVYYALTEDGSSKVIGSTTKHTSNHYLTSAASMKVWRIAADFYNDQIQNGITSPTLLHLNDASLKWGGVFDLDADWDEPHAEHRRGTVVDVRANSSLGAIPSADFDAFKKMARKLRIDPHFERGSTNQHFHLRLLNRPE